jgi:predicted nucleic acid-binding protein
VVDASPLILLGKIGQVGLLHELADELVVPQAVVLEVASRPEGAAVIEQVRSFERASVAAEVSVTAELWTWGLGPGESQVLALTSMVPGSRAVLDDLDGRRCAQAFGLPVIGTLGVVLRAKRKGVIPAARPVIDHLRRVGLFASDQLIKRALAHVEE